MGEPDAGRQDAIVRTVASRRRGPYALDEHRRGVTDDDVGDANGTGTSLRLGVSAGGQTGTLPQAAAAREGALTSPALQVS